MYPDAWLTELLQRTDIVSLVSDYVRLKEKGGRFWGLCPFHSEKTPSFSVSADKQLYYCFGCHAGGNAIHFIMDQEKLPFYDAVELLAKRVNLPVPAAVGDDELRKAHALREKIYEICKAAAKFYHERLMAPEGLAAREYLASRDVDSRMIVEFGLGYSPKGWDGLFAHLSECGFPADAIVASGVCVKKNERVFDAYRDRLIFPIIGVNNKVLGFGARTMAGETPKYINTPETPVFNKRQNLYGLNLVKSGKTDSIIIVEGYMDVIGLRQRGIKNAVASLGTALTQQQAKLCKRYCGNVYIAYDGDAAGQGATLRGLDILAAEGLNVRIISFDEGEDPDECIRKHGAEEFAGRIERAEPLNKFKLRHIKAKHDTDGEDGKSDYAIEACGFIATLSPVEQERYYMQLSKETNISVAALKRQGGSGKPAAENSIGNYRNNRTKYSTTLSPERLLVERGLLSLAINDAATLAKVMDNIDQFKLETHIKIAQMLQSAGHPVNYHQLISQLEPQEADLAAAVLSVDMRTDMDWALNALKEFTKKEAIHELTIELAEAANDVARRNEILDLLKEWEQRTYERIE